MAQIFLDLGLGRGVNVNKANNQENLLQQMSIQQESEGCVGIGEQIIVPRSVFSLPLHAP